MFFSIWVCHVHEVWEFKVWCSNVCSCYLKLHVSLCIWNFEISFFHYGWRKNSSKVWKLLILLLVMFMRYNGSLGFGVQVCLLVIWSSLFNYAFETLRFPYFIWLKIEFSLSLKNFNFDFCHVFLSYNGILRFGVQVCLLTIWSFTIVKDKICVIESINGVYEVLFHASIVPFWFHNFFNVENVQLAVMQQWVTSNEMYIQAMEQQVLLWKSHSKKNIC